MNHCNSIMEWKRKKKKKKIEGKREWCELKNAVCNVPPFQTVRNSPFERSIIRHFCNKVKTPNRLTLPDKEKIKEPHNPPCLSILQLNIPSSLCTILSSSFPFFFSLSKFSSCLSQRLQLQSPSNPFSFLCSVFFFHHNIPNPLLLMNFKLVLKYLNLMWTTNMRN